MDPTELARDRATAVADRPDLVGEPVRIRDELGRFHGWFVPLVEGDRIVGFIELDEYLIHRRTSRFAARAGSAEHPPPATWWLDPTTVLEHARPVLGAQERAGEPYLSFDGVPDRLAWAIPVTGPEGNRLVYVAGTAAWSASSPRGFG